MKKLTTLTAITFALMYATASASAAGCCSEATPAKEESKADSNSKAYPLTTCVVSGEKLGEMGAPYVFTHEGTEVKLCCKSCLKKFNADPAKYLKKIEEAGKAAK